MTKSGDGGTEPPKQSKSTGTPNVKLSANFAKTPTARLLAGVGSGWLSGMITVRAGKIPIAILGTSIIAFQAAQNQGLVKHTWGDVQSKATEATEGQKGVLMNAKKFAVENPAFAAGFTGGFLIGLTC